MNEPLMVGTRGWEHAAWSGGFYPDDLPEDWRFCFYSNNLRSALVPQTVWDRTTRRDVEQWVTDSDPEFRFVVELPAGLCVPTAEDGRDRALAGFQETIEPILPRISGILIPIATDTPVSIDWFEHLLNTVADIAPLCVDLPDTSWRRDESLAAVARQGAGLAWHCAREPDPRAGGQLLVGLAPTASARELRHWIEKMAAWQQPGTQAGLFIDAPEASAKAAQEARIIAELMGV